MPAHTRSTRSPPAWRRRRSPAFLPGPYDFGAFRCTTWSVATNKPPILPYRGVAYAMETLMDAIAAEAGLEPDVVRLRNLVPPEGMPFDNTTARHFDSGDYPEAPRRAATAIGLPAVRVGQAAKTGPMRTGVGLAVFCKQGAHGTSVYAGWGIPMMPGWEQAAHVIPDGGLETTPWRRWRTRCWASPSPGCAWCTATPR
jgi:carbon-monoxide dehydrogenase large subunit